MICVICLYIRKIKEPFPISSQQQQRVLTLKPAPTNVYNFADFEKKMHLLKNLLLWSAQIRKTECYHTV